MKCSRYWHGCTCFMLFVSAGISGDDLKLHFVCRNLCQEFPFEPEVSVHCDVVSAVHWVAERSAEQAIRAVCPHLPSQPFCTPAGQCGAGNHPTENRSSKGSFREDGGSPTVAAKCRPGCPAGHSHQCCCSVPSVLWVSRARFPRTFVAPSLSFWRNLVGTMMRHAPGSSGKVCCL